MILDIVGRAMDSTSSRVSTGFRASGKWVRSGLLTLAFLLVALAGCGERNGDEVPPASREPSTIVVSTVEPTGERPTETPTAVPPTPTATPPAPLAARVNGEYVFLADYERRVAQYQQALRDLDVDLAEPEAQTQLAQARQDILEGMIDDVLIAQGAAEMEVEVGEEELEARVAADIESGGGLAASEEWLEEAGLSREDYKGTLQQSMLAQRVWDEVTADVPAQSEQVHARHIVVGSQEAAAQIAAQVRDGADFVALARQHSLDQATKENGGDLGWFPRGIMAVELENAAFSLQPGETSDGVALGEHYHVIQVVEREAARALAAETLMQLRQERFAQWLDDLREMAVIERYVEE